MIYNTPDIIPFKIYIKILETDNYRLLVKGKEKVSKKKLKKIWETLQDEDDNEKSSKVINLFYQIGENESKFEAIQDAIRVLRVIKDQEIIDLLKSFKYVKQYGFDLDKEDINEELDRIENESKSIQAIIDNIREKLPKQDKKKSHIDQVILAVFSIAKLGFVNTNKVTKSQFDAALNICNKIIEQSNKNGEKRANKR
jgi:hypothetical protein